MLTEKQAIEKVNNYLQKYGQTNYLVRKIRSASWGWIMYWVPDNVALYGSSPYLCHKNGYFAEMNKVAWYNKIDLADFDGIVKCFIADVERLNK